MIDEWVPPGGGAASINAPMLQQCLAVTGLMADNSEQAAQQLGEERLKTLRSATQLGEEQWLPLLATFSAEELFQLATFFTLAEMKFSGWQCGAKNPAIWIFRSLKKNGQLPEKGAIRQLKSLTDNRYIPYGSAL
ncbi:hypothetical protein [Thalassolituus hydrocarboniclasticus]|uniref:Antitoxin Xre/MbcA/ParS-like toxin-binding domain-containing protein n=1 Tax=Thalassolituus hydrocarboniclasticus TaxID=2742796 RepID=A0ABY6A8U5_9GAMM|nr:hypothetical protein [Thalassolituus hydrocarboniclasticus]UXD87020.1 hypothetical protein HUF19_05995 [Thalassolituus hydrocarboniclasticus]